MDNLIPFLWGSVDILQCVQATATQASVPSNRPEGCAAILRLAISDVNARNNRAGRDRQVECWGCYHRESMGSGRLVPRDGHLDAIAGTYIVRQQVSVASIDKTGVNVGVSVVP